MELVVGDEILRMSMVCYLSLRVRGNWRDLIRPAIF